MPEKPDDVVIGVDVGALSGRAVVVPVRAGAELDTAIHSYVRQGLLT